MLGCSNSDRISCLRHISNVIFPDLWYASAISALYNIPKDSFSWLCSCSNITLIRCYISLRSQRKKESNDENTGSFNAPPCFLCALCCDWYIITGQGERLIAAGGYLPGKREKKKVVPTGTASGYRAQRRRCIL